MSHNEEEQNPQVSGAKIPESDQKQESRREFFHSLGKWSKVVIAAVVLGETAGAAEAKPVWVNGGWHNGGWHNGGWHNGGWRNRWRNGGWYNTGWYDGGWTNRYFTDDDDDKD